MRQLMAIVRRYLTMTSPYHICSLFPKQRTIDNFMSELRYKWVLRQVTARFSWGDTSSRICHCERWLGRQTTVCFFRNGRYLESGTDFKCVCERDFSLEQHFLLLPISQVQTILWKISNYAGANFENQGGVKYSKRHHFWARSVAPFFAKYPLRTHAPVRIQAALRAEKLHIAFLRTTTRTRMMRSSVVPLPTQRTMSRWIIRRSKIVS